MNVIQKKICAALIWNIEQVSEEIRKAKDSKDKKLEAKHRRKLSSLIQLKKAATELKISEAFLKNELRKLNNKIGEIKSIVAAKVVLEKYKSTIAYNTDKRKLRDSLKWKKYNKQLANVKIFLQYGGVQIQSKNYPHVYS